MGRMTLRILWLLVGGKMSKHKNGYIYNLQSGYRYGMCDSCCPRILCNTSFSTNVIALDWLVLHLKVVWRSKQRWLPMSGMKTSIFASGYC